MSNCICCLGVYLTVRVFTAVDSFIRSKSLLASCKLCMSGGEERGETAHIVNFTIKRHIQEETGTIRYAKKNIRTKHLSFKVHESRLMRGGLNKNSLPPQGQNYC